MPVGWQIIYFFLLSFRSMAIGLVVNHEQNFITIVGLILRRMKWHILFFFILGPLNIPSDASITPNDHRNLFLFFFVYYVFLILFIPMLLRFKTRFSLIFCIMPSLFLLFLLSDGVTTKAGQWNRSGTDPEIKIRSFRHKIFLDWHSICDGIFGNVENNFFGLIGKRIDGFY
ncbi:hypothetical protein LEP1GSC051_2157 [Leptospira sp. P2653]|nr:hypothetical protein LEP1GSC051_2157 [Leptospira sp. P2653]EMN44269.1 hypothetical protein LEP1GSC086_2972 [Leptospira weilii str. LNT 1234]